MRPLLKPSRRQLPSWLCPAPAGNLPTILALLQSQCPSRAGLLHGFAVLLVRVIRRNDNVGAVAGNIHMPGFADGDDAVGDPSLLGVSIKVRQPFRARTRSMPLVRRN